MSTSQTYIAVGDFKSFTRTGGEWRYEGGMREPGRFTAKLAPAVSSCPITNALRRDREEMPITPAPRYDTQTEITKRCRERGTGEYLPAKGEELGVKFLKALRATGPGWERPSGLSNVETPWGNQLAYPWREPKATEPVKVKRPRRQRVAA